MPTASGLLTDIIVKIVIAVIARYSRIMCASKALVFKKKNEMQDNVRVSVRNLCPVNPGTKLFLTGRRDCRHYSELSSPLEARHTRLKQ